MEISPSSLDGLPPPLSPQLATAPALITGTLQKGQEVEQAVRVADPNKGQNVDVSV